MYVVWHSDLDQGPLSILSYVCESFAKYLVIVLYFCKHEEIKVGYATQRIWWSLDRCKEEVSICGGGEEKNNKFTHTQRLKWTQYENITFWADDDNLRCSIPSPFIWMVGEIFRDFIIYHSGWSLWQLISRESRIQFNWTFLTTRSLNSTEKE